MRTASAFVTLALLVLQGHALACQCSTPAPMAGEDRAAYLTRVWSFRLNLPYAQQKHVFIATVDQNKGWSHAMTENGGRWPVALSDIEVLAGSAPPDGVVQNSNPCGATMAIGTRIDRDRRRSVPCRVLHGRSLRCRTGSGASPRPEVTRTRRRSTLNAAVAVSKARQTTISASAGSARSSSSAPLSPSGAAYR